jgi:hypothetical protein
MNSNKRIVITSMAALLVGALAVVHVYKNRVNPGLRRRIRQSMKS